jgi:hypothetical protein
MNSNSNSNSNENNMVGDKEIVEEKENKNDDKIFTEASGKKIGDSMLRKRERGGIYFYFLK